MKTHKLIYLLLIFVLTSCLDKQRDSESKITEISNLKENDKLVLNTSKDNVQFIGEDLVIGYLDENNDFKFTSDEVKEIVKKQYSAIVLKEGYQVDFEDFEFISKDVNNGYYMLTSFAIDKTKDESVNLGRDLLMRHDLTFVFDDNTTSVSCTGCRRGCNPRRETNGDGYCTDCKIANSNCTKTESN